MHLYTHGIHVPGFPHSDLHAQWSKLESMELTDSIKTLIHHFLETPQPQNGTQFSQKSKNLPHLQLLHIHKRHQVPLPQTQQNTS